MDTVDALQQLGFTEYEARAYAALTAEGELNGYALAKITGIPRANIYAVAEKLLARGAISRSEHEGGQRYVAVAPSQLLRSLESAHRRALDRAGHALARHARKPQTNAVFNLRGPELLARGQQLVDGCEDSLLIAVQPVVAAGLADCLRAAAVRGVQITTLCLEGCGDECGGCQGAIHRYDLAPEGDSHCLVLVVDRHTALLGQIGEDVVEGVMTSQPAVVALATDYIRQNLVVAALCKDAHGPLETRLSADALAQLNDLYPGGGIPAYLRALGG